MKFSKNILYKNRIWLTLTPAIFAILPYSLPPDSSASFSDSPGHVQSTGHVGSTSFSALFFQRRLAVLPIIPAIKIFT